MNKQEMNELIAEEIMGYEKAEIHGMDGWKVNSIVFSSSLFNPAENFEHAWKVAAHLFISITPQCGAPKEYSVHASIDNQPLGNYYEAFAETAPLAICKVALKSTGLYKEKE